MKKFLAVLISGMLLVAGCQPRDKAEDETSPITPQTVEQLTAQLLEKHGTEQEFRITRGVSQAASLWRNSDGTVEEFEAFVLENFIADAAELDLVFDRIAHNMEFLYGHMNRILLELNRQIHEDRGPIHKIDQLFGAYSPTAHIENDFFRNKIAFIVALNFPNYSLEEKNDLGAEWTPRQWGFARLGDMFTARVPASYLQEMSRISSETRLYISEYNIFAGRLLDNEGNTLFPEEMRLLAHWNVRDEIRANYGREGGLPRQEMLYNVMLRIIHQDIPSQVINNNAYQWNPFTNQLLKDGQEVEGQPEGVVRYQHLLNNFQALRNIDRFHPKLDTYLKRRFEADMEIPKEEVKALFAEYASSPLLRQAGQIISQRLGRPLQPFDLWYDGFKARAGFGEGELDRITKTRYPNAAALDNDIPRILKQLGWTAADAEFLGQNIDVDAARGSGHAWGTSMRNQPAHLRTRIAADGMDYKGYNIAIHELGHNVEQVISLHKADNYMINGVPNVGFTEAIAFMFQARDMEFLGIRQADPLAQYEAVLDVFWTNYEMMGVSLLDIKVWEWLYENPNANAVQLKEAVIRLAKEVWNEFYADTFGVRDVPILAIYSHMIQSPLYLMNYPYGRLIKFQLENYFLDKNFADETNRIFALGRLTPRHWMQRAVDQQISNEHIFQAAQKAIDGLKAASE